MAWRIWIVAPAPGDPTIEVGIWRCFAQSAAKFHQRWLGLKQCYVFISTAYIHKIPAEEHFKWNMTWKTCPCGPCSSYPFTWKQPWNHHETKIHRPPRCSTQKQMLFSNCSRGGTLVGEAWCHCHVNPFLSHVCLSCTSKEYRQLIKWAAYGAFHFSINSGRTATNAFF